MKITIKKRMGKKFRIFKTCSFCDQAPKEDKKGLIPITMEACEECYRDFSAFMSEMEEKRRKLSSAKKNENQNEGIGK